jgi:hypothetical protein
MQQVQLLVVLVGQLVAVMDEHLRVGAEAPDRASSDVAVPSKPGRGVHPLAAVLHLVDATSAGGIEEDRVDVDLATGGVDRDEASRCRACDRFVPTSLEEGGQARYVGELDDQVEIVMHPCLTLEPRVDTPATVEPDRDVVGLDQRQQPHYLRRFHGAAWHATAIGPRRAVRRRSIALWPSGQYAAEARSVAQAELTPHVVVWRKGDTDLGRASARGGGSQRRSSPARPVSDGARPRRLPLGVPPAL